MFNNIAFVGTSNKLEMLERAGHHNKHYVLVGRKQSVLKIVLEKTRGRKVVESW